jgi:hypothetical protein
MANLKIRIFKSDNQKPETTITIPLFIIRFAKKLIPKNISSSLQEKGIDLDLIVELSQNELSQNEEIRGTLVEIEEHEKNKKIVIAIE